MVTMRPIIQLFTYIFIHVLHVYLYTSSYCLNLFNTFNPNTNQIILICNKVYTFFYVAIALFMHYVAFKLFEAEKN